MLEMYRSGNMLSMQVCKDALSVLRKGLRYTHRTFYEGQELRERQRRMIENPTLKINPRMELEERQLYELDGNTLYCLAGLKHRVEVLLGAAGIKYKFTDLRSNTLEPADWDRLADLPGGISFRHRQDEVLATIEATEGCLIGAPTGYGKTHLAVYACAAYPNSRVAFISSGLDLIKSTYTRLNSVFRGQVGRIGDGHFEDNKRITLISIDSLHKAKLDKYQLIIGDEVHEFGTDRRIGLLCSSYTDAKWVGFSASLGMRSDNADIMVEAVFGPKAIDITYAEATANNVVVPIYLQVLDIPGDITTPTITGSTQLKKRNAYWAHLHRNEIFADAAYNAKYILNDGDPDPQTLVMTATVEHAFNLRNLMPDYEVVYASLDPRTKRRLVDQGLISSTEYMSPSRRDSMLRRFEAGTLKKVISTHCWKKGINPQQLKVFVRADGETSSINNVQLPGRLSRVYQGKDRGLLIDGNDRFDDWAARRAANRLRDYRALGFKEVKGRIERRKE